MFSAMSSCLSFGINLSLHADCVPFGCLVPDVLLARGGEVLSEQARWAQNSKNALGAFSSFWAGGKTSPWAYGWKNLALAWKGWETSACARDLSGGAEDGEGVGYLQGLLGEAETASGTPAFGARSFTLTGGGELPTATEHPLQVGGGDLVP